MVGNSLNDYCFAMVGEILGFIFDTRVDFSPIDEPRAPVHLRSPLVGIRKFLSKKALKPIMEKFKEII